MSRKQKVLKYRLLQSRYALWKNVVHVFTTSQLFVSIYTLAAPPSAGVVTAGSATISQSANQTTIQQNSAKTAINWNSFSIDPSYTVRYIQPDASSIALNRVTGNLPTSIQGQLLANGQVWILNPNGVYISKTGTVNTSSFLASTNSISDTNFMSGNYSLTSGGISGTYVTNEGRIVVSDGGYAVLTGQAVRNDGYIQANLGQAVLAGAKTATLNIFGNQLMSFAITSPVDVQPLDGRAIVDNTGNIQARGGTVLLSAKAASNLIGQVVNTSGMIQATSAKLVNGVVVLDGGDNGEVTISGGIDVSGKSLGETGGNVTILGQKINLASNASIDASGSEGGGTILIGGGWQGGVVGNSLGIQSNYTPATNVTIATGAVANASAIDQGDGGTIVVWSDLANSNSNTQVSGTLLAKGGTLSGNGGNVETSGHHVNINNATVNTQSVSGKIGNWLIDPTDFTIAVSGGDQTGAALSNALSNSSITISSANGTKGTSGNINVNDNISWTANNTILVLNATNNVVINADISFSGSNSNLTMNANNSIVLNSSISLINPSGLLNLNANTTGNGSINSYGNIFVTKASSISIGSLTGAGSISLGTSNLNITNASGNYGGVISGSGGFTLTNGLQTLSGNNTYTGGTLINNGTLQIGSDQNLGNSSGNVTFNATNAPILRVNGNFTTARGLILSNIGHATIDVTNGNTLTANGTISGNGTLVKSDAGTLIVNSANTYTGGTTILGGTLATPGGLGNNSMSSGSINLGGGTFEVMYPPGNGSYYLFRSDAFNLISGTNSTILVDTGINLGGLGNINGAGNLTINALGNFQNAGNLNTTGSLTILGCGTVNLSGINSYTGQTIINGGNLLLTGNGSIASSSGVVNNGTFNISSATNGASIISLTGNGNVVLGVKNLDISNANNIFSGNISGQNGGSLNILGGTQTLTGSNTFSAGLNVSNATVVIGSQTAVGTGTIYLANGILETQSAANFSFNNNISLTGASQFKVQGNTTDTLNGVISGNGSLSVMNTNGTSFGVLNFAGQNTYTGTTTLYPDFKLALIGNGSIANSDNIFNAGAFDISATSTGATIRNIENNAVYLGSKTLTITNAGVNGSGNLSIVTGGFSGDSSSQINLLGGSLLVSGDSSNTFLGSTVIGANTTLAIKSNGSISGSNVLNVSGILDLQTNNTVNLSNLKLTSTGLITNSNGSASLFVSGMSNLGGTVSTSGSQTYNGLVILGGNTTLNTLNAEINFGSTIDSKTGTSQNLLINTGSGITYLNGAVGSAAKLSSITLNGSSSILNSVNTTGTQTYGGNVTLTSPSARLNSDTASVNLLGNSFTPYQGLTYQVVGNLSALQNIGANNATLSGNWILGTDIDASFTASMNQGLGFAPIGTQGTPFIGNVVNTFNHTINNLSINRPTTDYVGLFGYVSNANISGIRMTNSNITGQSYVGGLVGYTINTNVIGNNVSGIVNGSYYIGGLIGQQTDSYVDESKTAGNVTGLADVGGLVGTLSSNQNSVNGNSINNSSSSATVVASGTGNPNEYQSYLSATNAGGLVGLNYAGGTINQSYATGNVSGTDPNSKFVGGLVGEMFQPSPLAINSSYATGNVYGGTNVGGLLGNANHGLINLSNASGNVAATGNLVGGLVGSLDYGASINTSYATGNVNGSLSGSSYVGGLVGRMGPGESISNSYASGNVNGYNNIGGLLGGSGGVINSSNASGNVSGGSYIGGLVGDLWGESSLISNSSATGSVVSTDTFVGGLVGYLSNGALISSSFATGNVSGVNLVGGLVGINAQSNISSSYATGVVSSQGNSGFLYGLNLGTVSADSYGTNGARYISNQTIYVLGNGTFVDSNQTLLTPSATGFFFSGDTLVDNLRSSINIPSNIILGNTNIFQVNTGGQLSLSGVLSGSGNFTKTGNGGLSLTNTNTYTGFTTISNGTLALGANGSIATSNKVVNNGTLDISNTSGSLISSLAGSGNVQIGNKTLIITNANDTFSGVISDSGLAGAGSLIIAGGTQTFESINTYLGPTQINSGSTLVLSGNGSINNSSVVNATGTFDIGGTSGSAIKSLSGNGNVGLGSQNLNITNANNTFYGVIADGGIIRDASGGSLTIFSGTQTLSAGNSSYTGSTLINSGATLALNGNGSIASSSLVNAAGTLDIGFTYGASIKSLSGNGTVALGSQNLNITNANDTFSGVIADGGLSPVISGVGGSLTIGQNQLIVIDGGPIFGGPAPITSNQTLTGPNTYTGNTTITEGAWLTLGGNGSISNTKVLSVSGTLDASGLLGTTIVTTLAGSGVVAIGAGNLTLSNANTTFSGQIIDGFGFIHPSGGSLIISNGTQTLSGISSYVGPTVINSCSTLALLGTGSIASSASVNATGTFDISATSGTSIKSLSGTGTVSLGSQKLNITNPNDTFSGVIADGGLILGEGGSLTIGQEQNLGTQTLSGQNSFTGTTLINQGATLSLTACGSIASSSEVNVSGTLDFTQKSFGSVLINSLTGNGTVNAGSTNYSIFNNQSFTGVFNAAPLSDPSDISDQILYLLSDGSLKNSNNTILSPGLSGFTLTNDIIIVDGPFVSFGQNIRLNGTDTFQVNSGSYLTLSGVLSGTGNFTKAGSGWLSLNNTNTYTGVTTIGNGTLALVGNGSIALSSKLLNNGAFDISTAKGSLISSLAGSGSVQLGSQTLTITNASVSDTFSGVISDSGPNAAGSLIIAGGTQSISGINSYVGPTQINSGAILAIIGNGSIDSSSQVNASGTFDISGASTLVRVQSLAGNGTIALGSQGLDILNANDIFSGGITDGGISGGAFGRLGIIGGTQTLAGVNSFTGQTNVQAGLILTGNGSVSNSSSIYVGSGTFDISNLSNGSSITSLDGYGVVKLGANTLTITNANSTTAFGGVIADGGQAGGSKGNLIIAGGTQVLSGTNLDGYGVVKLGANTLTITNANSTTAFGGVIADGGQAGGSKGNLIIAGGTQVLSGTNNYSGVIPFTGNTTINLGATLALVGPGSVASSQQVNVIGTLDISSSNSSSSIQSLSGSGNVVLGAKNLSITNASNSYSGVITDGGLNAGLGGSLTLLGGIETLSGQNTYTGGTTLTGGTLVLGSDSTVSNNIINTGVAGLGNFSSGPLGTGVVTLNGGNLQNGRGALLANNVVIQSGTTSTITESSIDAKNLTFLGNISGSGNVTNISDPDWSTVLAGDNSGFSGTFTQSNNAKLLIFAPTAGSQNANWVFNGNTVATYFNNGTLQFGSLNGNASIFSANNNSTVNIQVGKKGFNSSFGGVISDNDNSHSGSSLSLTKVGGNNLTLTNINSYSGQTLVNGGTLFLSGNGSIASSNQITNNGTFDISGTNGTTITSLVGLGNTALGSQQLSLSNASGIYSGVISGDGSLSLNVGTETLSGVNTYTGSTNINGGTLALSGNGSIASSSGVTNNATLNISGTNGTTITSLAGSGNTALGAQQLTLSNASGIYSGVINGTGSFTLSAGTEILYGVNTYTGSTSINGGTLVLSRNGSIASSSGVINNGTLNISGTNGLTFTSLAGSGNTILGAQQLTLSNASGVYSGVINGTGSLVLNAGTETLSGVNTFTGSTKINGGTLVLSGNGSIASSSEVTNNGTLDISGTNGSTITSLAGTGSMNLGAQQLTLSNASGIYSGVINGNGSLAINAGTETLSGANTYSGSTNINGGTLALSGNGSITNSSQVNATGTFDISGTNGTTITSLAGTGNTTLGAQQLTLSNASGIYSGVINGNGSLAINAGTETLSGANTYSGSTNINDGTLALSGNGSIASSSGVANNGTLNISGTNGTTITSLTGFGITNLGAQQLTLSNATGVYSGVINGTGSLVLNAGTETLSGANTYTGNTGINNGATLALSGNGSITNSSQVNATGTFDISGTNGTTITSLAGSGNTILGAQQLTLSNASGIYSGVINGTGSLALSAGTETLSGVNTYSGSTNINGGTLSLNGNGSIANSNGVTNNGTFDISGTNGTTLKTLSGSGSTNLGAQQLNLSNASGYYSGVMNGTGSFALNAGTETLMGANTYTGTTLVNNGATLTLMSNGSIANSSQVNAIGTFDISGVSPIQSSIQSLTGNGNVALGSRELRITNANDTFSGVIANAGIVRGIGGGIILAGGNQTLSGLNTYSGITGINSGATLALSGNGSIANSSQVNLTGAFDISGTNGTTITSLSGIGNTNLGAQQLTLSNASGNFSGVINGNGSLALNAGTETLSGVNTYSGSTNINGGTLLLSGNGSIANSSGVANNGTLNISGTNGTSITSLSGSGNANLGSQQLTLSNASGNFSGVINGTGSLALNAGSQTLSGVNTYSGSTNINGGTLALSGNGSIANSSGVADNGTFNIGGSNGTTITSLSGLGNINLGAQQLTLSNATGVYSGVINGTGGLALNAGTETLSGVNTYTGSTNINSGTLALNGNGSITSSSGVVNNGTFNISRTNGTTITSLSGMGNTDLGAQQLTLSNASGNFSGVINGTGSFALNAGTETLSGVNTYSGSTNINGGTLALSGNGSISSSSSLANNGIFDISATNGSTITSLAGTGSMNLGAQELTLSNASGNFSGLINGTGSLTLNVGTETLSGVNTYSGSTNINGGTLVLSGNGSISSSSDVANNGTLNISGTNGTTITSLSGIGNTTLGAKQLTLSNASGNFSGVITGKGGLVLNAGTETLSGVNAYSGSTNINGGTLALSGNGSIAYSSQVNATGRFDISGTNGTTITSLAGTGSMNLGAQLLTLSNASGNFSGVINGTGSLALNAGTETLSGVNTYTGITAINNGSTLALNGNGSISNSSQVNAAGTFDISGTLNSALITSLTGNGSVALGSKILNITNANETFSGVIANGGVSNGVGGSLTISGGTQTLAGVNTYSGLTSLNGGNLLLVGNGSIASSGLLNNGNLTVTSSSGATFSSLDGIGNINLGSYQLNLTNASGTYSGVINGTGGVALNSGSETFSGINTYTGPTLINGGTLILTGNGSITNSSSITNNGTFNIGNTSGTTITSLSGNGTTILGAQQLSFSNASGIYSGSINGTGSIALNQGSQTLLGVSNFSGGMSLSPGTTLSINSGQALGTGNITLVGSNTTAATLNILSNTTINNQIRVSGDPVFNIARGVVYTQTGVISDGISSGDVVVTGGGTLALTAPNTYTGPTTITSSTLALQGDGSIANSIGLTNNGTFDISATNGASIVSLSGNGNTNLGAKQLTLTNASGTYSGVLSGTGSFALNAGTETLSGVNTYTGGTSIQQGALLALSGNGSISKSQQLNVLGTFDISGSSNRASIVSLTGTGNVALGSNNLNLTNANDTFSGVIADGGIVNGVGGSLTISKGIETLDGINTYTGTTYIGANATLALAGVGSIENSQIVNVDGTFDISQITQTYDPDYAATFGNADIVSLAGSGRVALGSNVLIFNNANDTFSGVLADGGIGGGTAGSIYIEKGTQTLSGINTFTGEAYVEPRATLALIGQGSVATANTIVFDGVVDISGTSSGTNITGMSGYGTVYLGSKTLNITGPSNPLFETFSGDIQGTGQFNILDGTQTLSGTNHLTGDMTVTAGNTLTITSGAALGSGTLNLVGNTTTPAILSIKKSTTINNPIVISGDPTFNVAPGATYTQAGVISNGATPGDIVITGGGTVVLSAVNTYTGQTVINASSVLQLFGSGSISTSQILTNNGVFDISGALSGVSIQSLAGLGQIIRGSNVLNILDTPQIPVSSNPSQNLLIISTPVSPPQISAPIGQTITNNELSIGSKSTLIPTSTTGPTLTSPVISNNPSTANPSSNNVTSGITNTEAVQVVTQTTAVSFIDSTPTSTNSVVSSSSSNSGSSNTASTTTSSVGTSVEPSTQNTSPSSAVADSAPSPKLNSKSVPADSLDQGDTSLAQVTVPGSNAPAPKSESRRELRVSTTPVATGVAIQKVIPIKQPVTKVFQHPISGSWSGKE